MTRVKVWFVGHVMSSVEESEVLGFSSLLNVEGKKCFSCLGISIIKSCSFVLFVVWFRSNASS